MCHRPRPLRVGNPKLFLRLPLLRSSSHRHARSLRTSALDYARNFTSESRLSPRTASTVEVQRACTSPTSVRFTRPAPDSMAGLAEWLRHWIVAPVTRVRFSHLAPSWAVRIRGLPTACNREMRVQLSHRPPDFGS